MTLSQQKIQRAINLANGAHQNEWRKGSGLPYITHIYDIMKLASNIGISTTDYETYCTIALHDAYESGMSIKTIERELGVDIADNVSLLSYIPEKGIPDQLNQTRKQSYLDSFADPTIPLPVLLVKALDRLCNVVDFYNSPDYNYAQKYLRKADALFGAIVTRYGDLSECYGWEVARNLTIEYYKVNELVSVDPHF